MNVFYAIILGIPVLILLGYIMGKPTLKKVLPKKKLSLTDFKQTPQEEKDQLFMTWSVERSIAPEHKRTAELLDRYARESNLPTFKDWRKIHGYAKVEGTSQMVYNDWLKFIGAHNLVTAPEKTDS